MTTLPRIHFPGGKTAFRLALALVLILTQTASLLAAQDVSGQGSQRVHSKVDISALTQTPADNLDPAALASATREGVETEIESGGLANTNFAFEPFLTTGREDGRTQRVLLEPSLYKLPTNITVNSATLQIGVCEWYEYPGVTRTFTFRRVTSPWHQSLATWNNAPSTGEVVGTVRYTVADLGYDPTWLYLNVTNLVKAWQNGTYPNYGLYLTGYESESGGYIRFCSNETTGGPLLTINYTTKAPTLAASPAGLTFFSDTFRSEPTPQELLLKNTGSSPLNWQAGYSSSWLHLAPSSGVIAPGGSQTIAATASIADLPSYGEYSDQITLTTTTPNAQGFPKSIPVTFAYADHSLALMLPMMVKPGSPAPPPADTAVLIIGVADYLYLPKDYGASGIRTASPEDSLYFAGQDGAKIHKTLRAFGLHKDRGGASLAPSALPSAVDNMLLLTDSQATFANIQEAFAWLDEHEGANTNVLIFYSGHGGPTEDLNGDEPDGYDEFITPYDADVDPSTGRFINVVTDDLLDSWLDQLESNKVAVLLDSCFSGGMAGASTPTGLPTDLRSRFLPPSGAELAQLADTGTNGMALDIFEGTREIITASAANESSFETGQLQQGVFSYYLLMAMMNPATDTNHDMIVSVQEAYTYLRPRVINYVNGISYDTQTPQRFKTGTGSVGLNWSTDGW